jgi:serine/threonine protein kinase
MIGQGAFGCVYLAMDTDTSKSIAIKFEMESVKKPVLKVEIALLKKLKGDYICPYIDGGRANWNGETMTFMVMKLLVNT